MSDTRRFAGIDVGSLTAQAVLIEDGHTPMLKAIGVKFDARSIRVKSNPLDSARTVMGELLDERKLGWGDITYCVSTGYGRDRVEAEGLAQQNMSEISCHGVGAFSLAPQVRTIIDIGGQDAKVIRVDENGDLVNFVMNDKCAAGTGRFLEVMSRTLGISFEDLGPLAIEAHSRIELSSRCSIFAETEVLHYIQKGVNRADLASGITKSMADRVMALVRRVGMEKDVMMTGGVAKNVAVRSELEKMLNVRMIAPHIDPQLIGAYGAAVLARRTGDAS
ncbi:MAG: acyl-CoA dehydratase activase [Actinomycetota bacterium]